MSGEQFKVMYFGPKPEGRSHEDFRARWRKHGELAMSLPLWDLVSRYQQFDALTEGERGVTAGHLKATANDRFGGVGSVWYRSRAHLDAQMGDTSGVETMAVDEVQTFGRALGSNLAPVVENRVIDRGPAEITVLALLHRVEGITRDEFSERWRALAPNVSGTPELERHLRTYVQNHTLSDVDGWVHDWDGLVELGFDSLDAQAAFFAEPKFTDWLSPIEAGFIDFSRVQMLIAAETIQYEDAAALAGGAQAGALR